MPQVDSVKMQVGSISYLLSRLDHHYIVSPFLSELLEQHEDQEEPVNITLAGVEYRELMAMMNLIYVGK